MPSNGEPNLTSFFGYLLALGIVLEGGGGGGGVSTPKALRGQYIYMVLCRTAMLQQIFL